MRSSTRLYSDITWGQRGISCLCRPIARSAMSVLGWTDDAQELLRVQPLTIWMLRGFFDEFMWDMIDCQQPSGAFSGCCAGCGLDSLQKNWSTRLNWYAPDNTGSGDAGVSIIPWTLYLMYGNVPILETHYEAMSDGSENLHANTEELFRPDYPDCGDWLSIDADTPNKVLATAYFAYSTKVLGLIANVLGKEAMSAAARSCLKELQPPSAAPSSRKSGHTVARRKLRVRAGAPIRLADGELKEKAMEPADSGYCGPGRPAETTGSSSESTLSAACSV